MGACFVPSSTPEGAGLHAVSIRAQTIREMIFILEVFSR